MAPPDLDAWIERLRKCEHLEEDELKTLCEMVSGMCVWGGGGEGRGVVFYTADDDGGEVTVCVCVLGARNARGEVGELFFFFRSLQS